MENMFFIIRVYFPYKYIYKKPRLKLPTLQVGNFFYQDILYVNIIQKKPIHKTKNSIEIRPFDFYVLWWPRPPTRLQAFKTKAKKYFKARRACALDVEVFMECSRIVALVRLDHITLGASFSYSRCVKEQCADHLTLGASSSYSRCVKEQCADHLTRGMAMSGSH